MISPIYVSSAKKQLFRALMITTFIGFGLTFVATLWVEDYLKIPLFIIGSPLMIGSLIAHQLLYQREKKR